MAPNYTCGGNCGIATPTGRQRIANRRVDQVRVSAANTYEEESAPAAAEDRALATAFVRKHYGVRGTLRLHLHAFGWDLLRAPANVVLAPIFLLSRLLALLLHAVGARRWARQVGGARILFPTAVARAVGIALRSDLLARRGAGVLPADHRADRLIEEYTGIRSAVAEILTTALILVAGATLFRIATPGVISLAPVVTEHAARLAAVADFPLGDRLGGLWYSVFSVETPVWHVVSVGVVLAAVASLITTFAGVIADPVQKALGIHRWRLLRLLTRLDAAAEAPPGPAPEHLFARGADIADAAVSLWRIFRP